MQNRIKLKDQLLACVQSNWTERERFERRRLAQQRQQWLVELVGIEDLRLEPDLAVLALAKAG